MQTERKTIYSKEQRAKDEKSLERTEQGKSPLDLSAFRRLMVSDLCAKTDVIKTSRIGSYSLDMIEQALANPETYPQVLVNTSRYLMGVSSFYMRLLHQEKLQMLSGLMRSQMLQEEI